MDPQDDINHEIKKIIATDAHEVLKSVIETFDVDTREEPIFELCFKNGKLRCAKMIFEKGVSEARLNACIGTSYDISRMSLEQVHFLIDLCKVDQKAFPKDMIKRYSQAYSKPAPKERKRGKCTVL